MTVKAWTPLLAEHDQDEELEYLAGAVWNDDSTARIGELSQCQDRFLQNLHEFSSRMKRPGWYDGKSHTLASEVPCMSTEVKMALAKPRPQRRSPPPTFEWVVLDTNVMYDMFLENDNSTLLPREQRFKFLNDLIANNVRIHVPFGMWRELDKHKTQGGMRQTAAKAVSIHLDRLVDEHPKGVIEVDRDSPKVAAREQLTKLEAVEKRNQDEAAIVAERARAYRWGYFENDKDNDRMILESARERVANNEACILLTSDRNLKLRSKASDPETKVDSLSFVEACQFLYNRNGEDLMNAPPSAWVRRLKARAEAQGQDNAANVAQVSGAGPSAAGQCQASSAGVAAAQPSFVAAVPPPLPIGWQMRQGSRAPYYYFHWPTEHSQSGRQQEVCFNASRSSLLVGATCSSERQYLYPTEAPPASWRFWHNGVQSPDVTIAFGVTDKTKPGQQWRPSLSMLWHMGHLNRQTNVRSSNTNWQWVEIATLPLLITELDALKPSDE
mmetsp:Transcript_56695/g.155861  ORF Transcript_56695/g.155861 Transcript_56695/m.155861 type:complete len:498 (+) Transcript_56695:236-1729(+)